MMSFMDGPLDKDKKNDTIIKLLQDEVCFSMLGVSIDSVS